MTDYTFTDEGRDGWFIEIGDDGRLMMTRDGARIGLLELPCPVAEIERLVDLNA